VVSTAADPVMRGSHLVVDRKDSAGGEADLAQITRGAQNAEDSQLRRQGAQLEADYDAGKVKAAAADIATMTATCKQWAKMGPPGC